MNTRPRTMRILVPVGITMAMAVAGCSNDVPAPIATVSIVSPGPETAVNAANAGSFAIAGTCSENGSDVRLTGSAQATATCADGKWETNLDLSQAADGAVTIEAHHSNSDGKEASQGRTWQKDSAAPSLALTSPEPNTFIARSVATAFVLKGTCSESGRDVTASGAASGSALCEAGAFELTLDFFRTADGPVKLQLAHEDAAGNAVHTSAEFVLDTTPPVVAIGSPAANSHVNAAATAAFAIAGTCSEVGQTVELRGAATASAACDVGGWSATLNLTIVPDGEVTIEAHLRDRAGNEAAPAARAFLKRAALPSVAITSPAEGSSIASEQAWAVPVRGTCSENGLPVVIGGDAFATSVCQQGNWSAYVDFSAMPAGPVSVRVEHVDAAGNAAPVATRSFTKAPTPDPVVTLLLPAAGTVVNAASVRTFAIAGTCSEEGQDVVLGGAAAATVQCASGMWSAALDVSGAAEGPMTVHADHASATGRSAARASRTFVKDTVAPVVAITSPGPGSYVNSTSAAAVAIAGTCSEDGRPVAISGAAAVRATCNAGVFNATLDLSGAVDGPLVITAAQDDAAGNVSDLVSRALVKDTSAPSITFTAPTEAAFANLASAGAFAVNGICSEPGQQVRITGGATATAPCNGGTFTATLDLSSAAEGPVVLEGSITDAAGNAASIDTRTFIKDTLAPSVAFTSPAPDTALSLGQTYAFAVAGTCSESGKPVVITGDASATVPCASGTWSATLNFSAAAPGQLTVAAAHVDEAGNPASAASRTFTKPSLTPAVALLFPAAGSYVNSSNQQAFSVFGSCTEDGEDVVLSGAASATVRCHGNLWNAEVDLTSAAQGELTLEVDHRSTLTGKTAHASRSFLKDTDPPAVAITGPAAGTQIDLAARAAFTITGSCSESGQAVVISGFASAAVPCVSGAFSANLDFTTSVDGPVVVHATQTDAAGNAATLASRSFVLDTVAPTVAILTPPENGFVNAAGVASVEVTGRCSEEGLAVVLGGGSGATATCTAGGFSTTLNLDPSPEGEVTLSAGHNDTAGNAAPIATRIVVKDTLSPVVAFTTPAAGTLIDPGNVRAFAVAGTCSENGQSVTIARQAASSVTCTEGTWSATLDLRTQPDGDLVLELEHRDEAGNVSATVARTFLKETLLPQVAITAPPQGTYINAENASDFGLIGTCTESGQPVDITGSITASVNCDGGAWMARLDFSAVADGHLSITVSHADRAGRQAPQAWTSFYKDALVPAVAITSPDAGSMINSDNAGSFQLSGTCTEAGRPVTLSGGASTTAYCQSDGTWNTNLGMWWQPDGLVTTYADHDDAAGNAAPTTNRSFTKDTSAPSVSITSPAQGTFVSAMGQSAFTLSGSCSEDGRSVEITGAAAATATCNRAQTPSWTATFDLTDLPDGSLNFLANHMDAAGNRAYQASVSVTKDTVAPTAPSIAINGGADVTNKLQVTLTLGAGGANQMYVTDEAGCASGATWETFATSKPWTLANAGSDGPPATAGNNTVFAKFRDAAGNESDCVSATIAHETLIVEPVYPIAGRNWMDYVGISDPASDLLHQRDLACYQARYWEWSPCLHAGELRKVELIGYDSCAGLTITDTQGVFDWTCRDASATPPESTVTFFTSGIRDGKGLRDLITATSWKTNSVLISLNGIPLRSSIERAWWNNPVQPLPDNGNTGDSLVTLSSAGIYTVSSSRLTNGYNLNSPKIALVGLGAPTLTWMGATALNCGLYTGETADPDARCMISAGADDFLWLENLELRGSNGTFAAHLGIMLYRSRFARLDHVQARGFSGDTAAGIRIGSYSHGPVISQVNLMSNGGDGLYIADSDGGLINGLRTINNTRGGVQSYYCSHWRVSNVESTGNQSGLQWSSSDKLRLDRVVASNNQQTGVGIGGVRQSRVSALTTFNNGYSGLYFSGSDSSIPSVLTDVTSFSNTSSGIDLNGKSVTAVRLTASNNSRHGVTIDGSGMTVSQLMTANNHYHYSGIEAYTGVGNTFNQIAIAHQATGVSVQANSSEFRFTGNLLMIGNSTNCRVSGTPVATPGLVDQTCTTTGVAGSNTYPAGYLSDASLRLAPTASSSFVGKVEVDDPVNSSDQSGARAVAEITDWTGFLNRFRGWGLDGSGSLASESQGRCTTGSCRIWDWRLSSTDTVLLNTSGDGTTTNPPFPTSPGLPCPSVVDGNVSTFDSRGNVFLVNAVELLDDGIGDDDALCESDEACLYTPNFGAYQGEGDYTTRSCVFNASGGPVTGVTIYAYPINGG